MARSKERAVVIAIDFNHNSVEGFDFYSGPGAHKRASDEAEQMRIRTAADDQYVVIVAATNEARDALEEPQSDAAKAPRKQARKAARKSATKRGKTRQPLSDSESLGGAPENPAT